MAPQHSVVITPIWHASRGGASQPHVFADVAAAIVKVVVVVVVMAGLFLQWWVVWVAMRIACAVL